MSKTDYTDEQISEALIAMVASGGNAAEASRRLAENDPPLEVPPRTLRSWRSDVHADRYRRLDLDYTSQLEEQIVAHARENARRAAEVERQLIERTSARVEQLDGKEAAIAAKNMSDVKSKNVEKFMALTGRQPTTPADQGMLQLVMGLVDRGILTPREPGLIEGPSKN